MLSLFEPLSQIEVSDIFKPSYGSICTICKIKKPDSLHFKLKDLLFLVPWVPCSNTDYFGLKLLDRYSVRNYVKLRTKKNKKRELRNMGLKS